MISILLVHRIVKQNHIIKDKNNLIMIPISFNSNISLSLDCNSIPIALLNFLPYVGTKCNQGKQQGIRIDVHSNT